VQPGDRLVVDRTAVKGKTKRRRHPLLFTREGCGREGNRARELHGKEIAQREGGVQAEKRSIRSRQRARRVTRARPGFTKLGNFQSGFRELLESFFCVFAKKT
jgi:hypothetical protein